jgi:hypothetical protein
MHSTFNFDLLGVNAYVPEPGTKILFKHLGLDLGADASRKIQDNMIK